MSRATISMSPDSFASVSVYERLSSTAASALATLRPRSRASVRTNARASCSAFSFSFFGRSWPSPPTGCAAPVLVPGAIAATSPDKQEEETGRGGRGPGGRHVGRDRGLRSQDRRAHLPRRGEQPARSRQRQDDERRAVAVRLVEERLQVARGGGVDRGLDPADDDQRRFRCFVRRREAPPLRRRERRHCGDDAGGDAFSPENSAAASNAVAASRTRARIAASSLPQPPRVGYKGACAYARPRPSTSPRCCPAHDPHGHLLEEPRGPGRNAPRLRGPRPGAGPDGLPLAAARTGCRRPSRFCSTSIRRLSCRSSSTRSRL